MKSENRKYLALGAGLAAVLIVLAFFLGFDGGGDGRHFFVKIDEVVEDGKSEPKKSQYAYELEILESRKGEEKEVLLQARHAEERFVLKVLASFDKQNVLIGYKQLGDPTPKEKYFVRLLLEALQYPDSLGGDQLERIEPGMNGNYKAMYRKEKGTDDREFHKLKMQESAFGHSLRFKSTGKFDYEIGEDHRLKSIKGTQRSGIVEGRKEAQKGEFVFDLRRKSSAAFDAITPELFASAPAQQLNMMPSPPRTSPPAAPSAEASPEAPPAEFPPQ